MPGACAWAGTSGAPGKRGRRALTDCASYRRPGLLPHPSSPSPVVMAAADGTWTAAASSSPPTPTAFLGRLRIFQTDHWKPVSLCIPFAFHITAHRPIAPHCSSCPRCAPASVCSPLPSPPLPPQLLLLPTSPSRQLGLLCQLTRSRLHPTACPALPLSPQLAHRPPVPAIIVAARQLSPQPHPQTLAPLAPLHRP